jgi:hypothetical protein
MATEKEPRKKLYTVYEGSLRPKGKVCHPMIKLSGKFLAEFGFNIGDSCEVVIEKDKIIITKQENKYFSKFSNSINSLNSGKSI